jgi:hypothetical protein
MEIEKQRPEIPLPEGNSVRVILPASRVRHLDFATSASFHRGPTRKAKGYRLILFSLAASAVDILLGFAFAALFTLSSSLFMRVDFMRLLHFFNGSIFKMFVVGFIISIAFYKVIFRVYLGFTVGEWACGIRLGKPQDHAAKNYAMRVLVRFGAVSLSGFIVLPALSLLFGQDLAGKISGLYLVQSDKIS